MSSAFIGVYVALYAYEGQTDQELTLAEGDLLYLLEKSTTDDWWKVKKRVPGLATEEPVGLVPSNYIEPAPTIGSAKALYDYDRQTEEEISFKEGAVFDIYDDSDNDWILVRLGGNEYGFVPANYIEKIDSNGHGHQQQHHHHHHHHHNDQQRLQPAVPAVSQPVMAQPTTFNVQSDKPLPPHPQNGYGGKPYAGDEEEEEEAPPLPTRPQDRVARREDRRKVDDYDDDRRRPNNSSSNNSNNNSNRNNRQSFFSWSIQEVDGRKKYRATLAIGNGTINYSPERSGSAPRQWDIADLLSYSSEKKHVFLEFQHPRASLDLHAGSKEVAEEIVSAMGEIAGANRAAGLKEVYAAANSAGQKMARVMYNFDSQGDDEITAREGDHVIIIDDRKSSEWWVVRTPDGEEGVIPASYLEILPDSKKIREKEREREQRERERDRDREHDRREKDRRKKPDMSKVRTWTDRSGTFKVDAALLGCADGKIHLHKLNGVKIAVAASKMSVEDLEYVESVTGVRLDDDKPLVDIRRKLSRRNTGGSNGKYAVPGGVSTGAGSSQNGRNSPASGLKSASTLSLRQKQPKQPEFDWFGFFLECGVDVNNCQRYAINFTRDQMDESILQDVSPQVLRNLGLKEGDILRVTKKLDEKFARRRDGISEQATGNLFSGADGGLKNNTRLSPSQMNVDQVQSQTQAQVQAQVPALTGGAAARSGFDDDAWTIKSQGSVPPAELSPPVKPPRPQNTGNSMPMVSSPARPASQPVQMAQPTGSMRDLMAIAPLQPQKTAESVMAEQNMKRLQLMQQQQQEMQRQQQLIQQQQTAMMTGMANMNMPRASTFPAGGVSSQPTGLIGQNTGGFLESTGGVVMRQQTGGLMGQSTGGGFSPNMGMVGQNTGGGGGMNLMSQNTGGAAPMGFNNQPMTQQRTGPSMTPLGPFATGNAQQIGFQAFPNQLQSQPSFSQLQQPTQQMFNPQQPFQNPLEPFRSQPFGMQQQPQQQLQQPMFHQNNYSVPSLTGSFGAMSLQQQQQQPVQPQIDPMQPFAGVSPSMSPGNPLQPLQGQPTGFGFGNSPLQPQRTGPHPPVSFSNGPQALQATPTGRRANLAAATPSNPFGF